MLFEAVMSEDMTTIKSQAVLERALEFTWSLRKRGGGVFVLASMTLWGHTTAYAMT